MSTQQVFQASAEAKGKAKQLRLFAFLSWIVAIVGEVYAILNLNTLLSELNLIWLIVIIVAMLALAITGSVLWKKANRLDPASEKDKFKFFVQSQLGAIMAVLAFLPLVIFIFTNKDADKKTKTIAGSVAAVALLIAGISGMDFNPPSIEKYTEEINAQTETVKDLNFDRDHVYWTEHGVRYHIFEDCQHLANSDVIHEGTVKECWDYRNQKTEDRQSELCKTCENRARKNKEESPLETAA